MFLRPYAKPPNEEKRFGLCFSASQQPTIGWQLGFASHLEL